MTTDCKSLSVIMRTMSGKGLPKTIYKHIYDFQYLLKSFKLQSKLRDNYSVKSYRKINKSWIK